MRAIWRIVPVRQSQQRRLVLALSGAIFLLWLGGSAMLPLLPAYLHARGASSGLVGVVMAAYFGASVVTQYPSGRLSDRVGPRPVLLAGFALFAVGSLGFAATTGPGFAVAFRGLQGIGAGAVTVASAATIGRMVDVADRGVAFSTFYGAQMLALAAGPLSGSVLGAGSVRPLFVIAAASAAIGSLPILAVVPSRDRLRGTGAPAQVSSDRPRRFGGRRRGEALLLSDRAVLGVAMVFVATGLIIGVYEATWTLLLRLRHASSIGIGLSWTLYTLPFVLLATTAGRLAQRADRRLLVLGALASSATFAVIYPFLHAVPLLVGMGALEAIGAVLAGPASMVVLTTAVPGARIGEAQGIVETARTGAVAISAAMSGALFGIDPIVPYATGSGLLLIAMAVIAWAWRDLRPEPLPTDVPATAATSAGGGGFA